MKIKNLYQGVPKGTQLAEELISTLHAGNDWRIERIVSTGHSTPPGEWYDQATDEWVLLLSGRAELRFTDPDEHVSLVPGDHLMIPAHRRHRVEATSEDESSVWLTLHVAPREFIK